MQLLKQSTAATLTVGPILDSTGAEYTGAVIGDISISKNGTVTALAASATLTSIGNGYYTLVLTTGNTDTLGRCTFHCNKSTYQMPVYRYTVLPATLFDMFQLATTAAGGIGDVQRVAGTAQTAGDLAALINTLDDYVDTEVAAIKAKTDNLPADPADASDIAASFSSLNTKVDTIDDFLDTEIAAIKAKTDNLPADPADASDIAASFTSLNTKVDTIDDFLDTEIAAIKAKTDQLTFTTANQVDAGVRSMAANTLTASALATDAVTEIVAAIFARTFEATKMSGYTFEDVVALTLCAVAAKLSGAAGTSIAIRNIGDTADAITATVDADGNRSVVTHTLASVR